MRHTLSLAYNSTNLSYSSARRDFVVNLLLEEQAYKSQESQPEYVWIAQGRAARLVI